MPQCSRCYCFVYLLECSYMHNRVVNNKRKYESSFDSSWKYNLPQLMIMDITMIIY